MSTPQDTPYQTLVTETAQVMQKTNSLLGVLITDPRWVKATLENVAKKPSRNDQGKVAQYWANASQSLKGRIISAVIRKLNESQKASK